MAVAHPRTYFRRHPRFSAWPEAGCPCDNSDVCDVAPGRCRTPNDSNGPFAVIRHRSANGSSKLGAEVR